MDKASNAIAILFHLTKTHQVNVEILEPSIFASHWVLVELTIDGERFLIQVDDEYEDFKIDAIPLSFCVVLRSLEEYKESTDFLQWCKKTGIETNNNALEYFRTLANVLKEIEILIEPIDSQISDIEFTTNAGAAQELRKLSL